MSLDSIGNYINSHEASDTDESLHELNEELREPDRHRKVKAYKSLHFWYSSDDVSYMTAEMANLYDKNSLEWILFNNHQIQDLFAVIIDEQGKDRFRVNERFKEKMAKNAWENEQNLEDWEIIESWEEYSLHESSQENFKKFLLSEDGVNILKQVIDEHTDPYWNIYKNYPLDKEILQIELRRIWFDKMHREYNEKYQIFPSTEEMEYKKCVNKITNGVKTVVWDYLKSGGDANWEWITRRLEKLLTSENGKSIILDMEAESIELDDVKIFLRESIKKYANRVLKAYEWREIVSLSTWRAQLDLQLKSYLFIYGKFFYPEDFKIGGELTDYDGKLLEIFKAFLELDGKLKNVQNNKFLKTETTAELKRLERDKQRRVEIAKRNAERNEHLGSAPKIEKPAGIGEFQEKSTNPNYSTWPEIAAEADLNLTDYNLDIEESDEKDEWVKETVFRDAYNEFIKSNNELKELITIERMRSMFDINSNAINNSELENFIKNNPLLKDMSPDEVQQIHGKISRFPSYFSEVDGRISGDSHEMKTKVNETVKTYAIWAVIDNVRDIFDMINDKQSWDFKWFQLNSVNPVIREGENIIISGSFNGSEVKVSYNLNNGELFMNSFLHELSSNKISIWKNSSIDAPIWRINGFDNILNNYYKLPPRSRESSRTAVLPQPWKIQWEMPWKDITDQENPSPSGRLLKNAPERTPRPRPMWREMWPQMPPMNENNINDRKMEAEEILNSQLNLIGEAIKNKTESQAQRNSAINKFMKTFNVISDSWEFSSWDFNKWSNLFDIIKIIENTGNTENGNIQSLEYFINTFMPKVMEYSWLAWWKRNEHQDKNNKKSKIIFAYNGDNENVKDLRDYTKDFNPQQFSWIANFESSHQLWFVDLIKKTIITWDGLNWKLDISKMTNFINDLDGVDKENNKKEENAEELDKKLEDQLSNIN